MIKKSIVIHIILLVIIANFSFLNAQKRGQSLIDSLKNSITEVKDTNQVRLLNKIAYNYKNIDLDSAFHYASLSKSVNSGLKWRKGEADNFNVFGNLYYTGGDLSQAFIFYNKALIINQNLKREGIVAVNYSNIGLIYSKQKLYEKAIENYSKSLQIANKLNKKTSMANTLTNLGNVYNMQGFLDQAKVNYIKAKEINNLLGRTNGVASNLINIADILRKQDSNKVALENYREALIIFKNLGHKFGIATCINYMAKLEIILGISSRDIMKQLYYAKTIAEELEAIELKKEIYFTISELYRMQGQANLFIDYRDKYYDLKDSIISMQSNEKILLLEQKYKNQEKARIKRERERNNAEIKKKTMLNQYTGIAIFIVFLGVIMFLSGKMKISAWIGRVLVFVTFIMLFEFILVIIDPWADDYSQGEPIIKLVINMLMALIIFPLHQVFENKVNTKIIKTKDDNEYYR